MSLIARRWLWCQGLFQIQHGAGRLHLQLFGGIGTLHHKSIETTELGIDYGTLSFILFPYNRSCSCHRRFLRIQIAGWCSSCCCDFYCCCCCCCCFIGSNCCRLRLGCLLEFNYQTVISLRRRIKVSMLTELHFYKTISERFSSLARWGKEVYKINGYYRIFVFISYLG